MPEHYSVGLDVSPEVFVGVASVLIGALLVGLVVAGVKGHHAGPHPTSVAPPKPEPVVPVIAEPDETVDLPKAAPETLRFATITAATHAWAGRCPQVRQLAEVVRTADAVFYAAHFASQPSIAKCLTSDSDPSDASR